MPALDPAWIALIGTICGGIGLKLLEHWLGKNKVKIDEATRLRDELRVEMNGQKDDIRNLEAEVDSWRKQYYDLRDKQAEILIQTNDALAKLRAELAVALEKANQNEAKYDVDPPPAP